MAQHVSVCEPKIVYANKSMRNPGAHLAQKPSPAALQAARSSALPWSAPQSDALLPRCDTPAAP